MNRITVFFALITFISVSLTGQIITTDPPEPSTEEAVTIIYDASEGDGGLMGYSGDLWAHTGVLTNLSGGPSGWRYVVAGWDENTDKAKMTYLGENKWELRLEPSIRDYYEVPEEEVITHLCFVFRNSDGSRTGRGTGGGDILYQFPTLEIEITLPVERWFMAEEGDRISIEARATRSDSIKLYHDGDLVTGVEGNYLFYEISAQPGGKHIVEVVASDSERSVSDYFSYAVRETFEMPEGLRDGINYIDDTTVILVLYAPEKDSVNVTGDWNDWEAGPENLMKNTPDGNRFWLQIDDLEPGKEYVFQYLVDGYLQIADPYTEKTSDYNDQFISEDTYPDLIRYPFNETTHPASVLQTAQDPYEWEIEDFDRHDQTNLVIYEMLIRDFTDAHDFKTVIDTLDYLENLGITAIELMPPSEFEGNVSWGYNPSFYFAPDKFYGPRETFKDFIDECHKRGIAVIMDMVLNHAYGRCPLVRLYWDDEKNQPAANNPWFNTVSPNPVFSWGYDFNHESDVTKAFVDSVNRFWMQEYKIDGFRFDFTKGFTNRPGDGGFYDPSRIAILERMADRIWEVEEDAYVILEHLAPVEEERELTGHGMMVWGNMNHSYRQAGKGFSTSFDSDLSWGIYTERGFSKPNLVSYMESHDEERLMFDFIETGRNTNPDYNIRDLSVALSRVELCANFFIPVPGPKMIWMFGELGYDYSIDYNGRLGRKPIKWDYLDDPDRNRLYRVFSGLNRLKSEHEVFKTDRFGMVLEGALRRITLVGDDMHVLILGNFDVRPQAGSARFTHTGWWYEYWTGDSLYVENVNEVLSFEPGEYLFYTDVKLDNPDIATGIGEIDLDSDGSAGLYIRSYPIPFTSKLHLVAPENNSGVANISLIDIRGRRIFEKTTSGWSPGSIETIDTDWLGRGVYFVKVEMEGGVGVRKLLK